MSGWYGWVVFAGIMLCLLGIFHAMVGFVALFQEDYFLVGDSGLMVGVDYTAWGWSHLILGVVIAGAGVALTTRGATWARVVAVVVAVISAVVNLGFMSAYPLWSVMMIVVDVLVIYAVTAHGGHQVLEQY